MHKKDILSQYGGIYPSNGLPTYKLKKPTFIIANTDRYGKPGRHWVAFYFPRRGPAEFFDSLGQPPSKQNRHFPKFLKKNSRKYIYTKSRLQSLGSSTCGPFVLYFVLNRAMGISMKDIMAKFDKVNLKQNDTDVLEWLKSIL